MRRRTPRSAGEVEIRESYTGPAELRLNAELIEWALENLISNAISALDQKPGRIEITVTSAESGDIEIVVYDSGRGMTPVEQGRAFEPGYTTKRRGWGLGLALARRVVEDYHRGRLFVRHSAPGEGTTMVIRLPAAKEGREG
jgi:signal transduction histidine kinase